MKPKTLVVFVFLCGGSFLFAQEIKLPQNPLKGQIVFEEKGCVSCHSIGGYGGTEGPDLSRELYFGSILELSSTIWNHTPQMNRKYRQLRMNRPQFSESEMLDLFGFLYYLRYLGEPGSVASGKKLLEKKGCISCHKVGGTGGSSGPELDRTQKETSPISIVQAMWNHNPLMHEQIKKMGIKYPTLSGQDVADITVYIRQASIGGSEVRMAPGDPANGRKVFENKKCGNCHLVEGKAKKIAPSLSRIDLRKGVTEVASSMWNHGPAMLAQMNKESIEWPRFDKNEMADLIAYLYFLGFEDKPGDEVEGEQTFVKNGCFDCHKSGGKAPNLSTVKQFSSPIQMIQLMWNHATEMEDLFISQNKKWPTLDTDDMRNVYAYLRKVSKK